VCPPCPRAPQALGRPYLNQRTKYLNFGDTGSFGPGEATGFYVTPSLGPSFVSGFRFSAANDSPSRDPLTFTLEGTNGDPATASWALIASGETGLQTDPGRNTWQLPGTEPSFPVVGSFTSYRLLFPTPRGPGQNSMQIGEVELLGDQIPEPGTFSVLALGALGLWRRRRRCRA